MLYTLKRSRYYYYASAFWIAVILSSCTLFSQMHRDPFYNDVGGSDSLRFPLIKPYEMIYLDKKYSWVMSLHANPPSKNTYYYFTLHDIRKLAVENGVIMVYTPYIEDNIDQSVGQKVFHWFAIVPSSNIEEGFEDETAFIEYIQQFNIGQPNWLEPNKTSEKFFQTGCLDWIPDCN